MPLSVSVVVPTANRPHYLRTALQSIARQTYISEVKEIIVSENLGNKDSESVCNEFPEMPVNYVFRELQLTNEEHIRQLLMEARGDVVAFLCDDDWWGVSHLEMGLRALSACPEASSWFSANLNVGSESATGDLWIWRPSPVWVSAGRPSYLQQWRMGWKEVVTAAWIVTPFHFSTMLARRSALHGHPGGAAMLRDSHPYYADRILYPGISIHGDILYEPLVDTFTRWHKGNWKNDKNQVELDRAFREGSDKIRRFGQENGFDPALAWVNLLDNLTNDVLEEISSALNYFLRPEEIRELGLSHLLPPPMPAPLPSTDVKRRMFHAIKRRIKGVVYGA